MYAFCPLLRVFSGCLADEDFCSTIGCTFYETIMMWGMEKQFTGRTMLSERHASDFLKRVVDLLDPLIYAVDMDSRTVIYANRTFQSELWKNGIDMGRDRPCWEEMHGFSSGPCPFCNNRLLLDRAGKPVAPCFWEFQDKVQNRRYAILDQAVLWHDGRRVKVGIAIDTTRQAEDQQRPDPFSPFTHIPRNLEMIRTMAGGVAHDFNNSLASILGNINLAQLTCSDPETDAYLRRAEKQIFEAKGLAMKFVYFAKQQISACIPCGVVALVRNLSMEVFAKRGVAFHLDIGRIPETISADPDNLSIAIKAVFTNAAEAVSVGGRVVVSINPEEDSCYQSRVIIRVWDSGPGIPSEHLKRVFDPYFTTKTSGRRKGTGLGLTLAWSIINRHGGEISLRSQKGNGTEVTLVIPA